MRGAGVLAQWWNTIPWQAERIDGVSFGHRMVSGLPVFPPSGAFPAHQAYRPIWRWTLHIDFWWQGQEWQYEDEWQGGLDQLVLNMPLISYFIRRQYLQVMALPSTVDPLAPIITFRLT